MFLVPFQKKGLENRSSRFEPKNSWLSFSRGSGPLLRSKDTQFAAVELPKIGHDGKKRVGFVHLKKKEYLNQKLQKKKRDRFLGPG